jgi:hypothetical protein
LAVSWTRRHGRRCCCPADRCHDPSEPGRWSAPTCLRCAWWGERTAAANRGARKLTVEEVGPITGDPASRRAFRACVEDHLQPVTGGIYDSRCRRLCSPQSSREVPAETQRSPPEPARGRGHSGRIGVRGGPETSGVVAGNRGGPVWPLEVPLRGAVAHRLRPVGISGQARSVTAGAGLAFRVARSGSSRARASCWLASRAVLGRYVGVSSGVVKPARMSQV